MHKHPTFVAYYRVSTERQGQSGLGLDAQKAAVAAFLRGKEELEAEFVEVESGRKNDRPQLAAALAMCRGKDGRVQLIAKLDRLARSVAFLSNLMESGVAFVAVDISCQQAHHARPGGRGGARARDDFAAAKAALAAAKARGTRLGNPRPDMARARAADGERVASFRASVLPTILNLRAEGQSLRQIAAELNARNLHSPRGRAWHASSMRAMLL